MAEQHPVAGEVEEYEHELAGYLQERIKPGLNSGAIPLLARSIAKEIAQRGAPAAASGGNEGGADKAEGGGDKADPKAEGGGDKADPKANGTAAKAEGKPDDAPDGGAAPDFEADMHELQAELGDDWVLSFSVQGDAGWLTAEKSDGSQHVEAQTAATIADAVGLLKSAGGRSG